MLAFIIRRVAQSVLVLLIVGKTILDLSLHVVEHRKTFSGAAVTG